MGEIGLLHNEHLPVRAETNFMLANLINKSKE